jgi:hypothetical protein
VQRRAIQLILDDGTLVTLLPEGTPLHPWALTTRFNASFLAEAAGAGASGEAAAVEPVRIAIAGAEIAELRLSRRPARLRADHALRLLLLAGPSTMDDLSDSALLEVLEGFRAGGAVDNLVSVVGLGPGLTPSGDDALVGTLAALDLGREANSAAVVLREAMVAALASPLAERTTRHSAQMLTAALMEELTRRTTRLSAQLLTAAAAGRYAEPVLGLLEALADEDPSPHRVEDAARVLLGLGHRSGRDTLLGIAAGLGRLRDR